MSVIQAFVSLFDNQEDCDVIFRIGSTTIGAHKILLKPRSTVLYNLTKDWTSKDDPLVINDISLDIFKAVLRYIYSDYITITDENVFKFLYAANFFEMDHLEAHCAKHINAHLCKVNVLSYVEHALEFSAVALKTECQKVFSKETNEILANPAFLSLSQPGLLALLDVEEINVLEIELFLAVKKWMVQQCKNQGLEENGANMRHVIGDALYKIHFPTMTMHDFSNEVTTIDGLLSETEMLQTYRKISVFKNGNLECPFSSRFRSVNCADWNKMTPCLNQLLHSRVIYKNDCYCDVIEALHKKNGSYTNSSHIKLILQCAADFMNSTLSSHMALQQVDPAKVVDCWEKYYEWIDSNLSKVNNSQSFMSKFFEVREALAEFILN